MQHQLSMNATALRALVEREIGTDWDHTNLHGVALSRCLVPSPRLVTVQLPVREPATEDVWLVLEEDPGATGYWVVYSERSKKFGLAHFAPPEPPYLVGEYGGFFDALDAM